MIAAVADTHAVVWYLADDPGLGDNARTFLERASATGDEIAVSTITLVELVYLTEKGRIPEDRLEQLISVLNDPSSMFVDSPVTIEVAHTLSQISRQQIPDMPDRIIAATGLHLNVPVISRDSRIRASNLTTIW